jgi:hypothetical protein
MRTPKLQDGSQVHQILRLAASGSDGTKFSPATYDGFFGIFLKKFNFIVLFSHNIRF